MPVAYHGVGELRRFFVISTTNCLVVACETRDVASINSSVYIVCFGHRVYFSCFHRNNVCNIPARQPSEHALVTGVPPPPASCTWYHTCLDACIAQRVHHPCRSPLFQSVLISSSVFSDSYIRYRIIHVCMDASCPV